MQSKGKLYLIGTPIGNLDDITIRALKTLKECDVILCEDTRVTLKLLTKFSIKKRLIAFHGESRGKVLANVRKMLLEGRVLGYVTDAGMPSVSDPGPKLVETALSAGCQVISVPGVSAVTTAISYINEEYSGFTFVGYKTGSKSSLLKLVEALESAESPTVVFVPPHDLKKLLQFIVNSTSDNLKLIICRELTKKFEEVRYSTVGETLENVLELARGELTLVFMPTKKPKSGKLTSTLEELRINPIKLAKKLKDKGFSGRDILRLFRAIKPSLANQVQKYIYNK